VPSLLTFSIFNNKKEQFQNKQKNDPKQNQKRSTNFTFDKINDLPELTYIIN
jgi:hypothetical protein